MIPPGAGPRAPGRGGALGGALRFELRLLLRDPLALALGALGPALLWPLLQQGLSRAEAADRAASAEELLTVAAPAALLPWLAADPGLRPVEVGRLEADEGPADLPVVDAILTLRDDGGVDVAHLGARGSSARAARRVAKALEPWQDEGRRAAWRQAGAPLAPGELVDIELIEEGDPDQAARRSAAGLLPVALTLLMLTTALYAALDTVVGERERGTAETLLSTRAPPATLLWAKALIVLGLTLTTGLAGVGAALLGGAVAGDGGAALAWPGLGQALAGGAAGLSLGACLGAAAFTLALRARSWQQAQGLSVPLLLGCVAPAAVAAWPGLGSAPALLVLPLTGHALIIRDAVAGELSAGAAALGLVAAAAWAAAAGLSLHRQLGRDGALLEPPPAPAHHGRGAALTAALGLLGVWYFGQLSQLLHLVGGLVFTQIVLLGGLGLAAPWVLGVPLRRALSLRRPAARDLGLAAAAGLGLPGLGELVLRAQSGVFPASEGLQTELLKAFDLDLPLPAMLLLIAVLPAICEELLFRGAVLGLLRGAVGPAARVLLTAAAFGLIHLSYLRLLPTAALGALMAIATLRSRSLFPAMLMHGLNNGLWVLWSAADGAEARPPLAAAAGGAALALIGVAAMGRGAPPAHSPPRPA